jgi:hypothetical protein
MVNGSDAIYTGAHGGPYSAGDVLWEIPWDYITNSNTRVRFTTVPQHGTADSTGKARIEKGGSGFYSAEASDPTSGY